MTSTLHPLLGKFSPSQFNQFLSPRSVLIRCAYTTRRTSRAAALRSPPSAWTCVKWEWTGCAPCASAVGRKYRDFRTPTGLSTAHRDPTSLSIQQVISLMCLSIMGHFALLGSQGRLLSSAICTECRRRVSFSFPDSIWLWPELGSSFPLLIH